MVDMTTIAGVYASQPSEMKDREAYYDLLSAEEWIDGAEIPYPAELAEDATRSWLAKYIPSHWHSNNITLIPGTMQNLQKNHLFGLASPDSEGRLAAIEHLGHVRHAIADFVDMRGSADIHYIQIHTAPKKIAQTEAMKATLEEILKWDWSGAQLVIEHCDRYIEGQHPEKGFLELSEECALAQEFNIGITINWGRTVVESRDPLTVQEHINMCSEAGVLTGLMFSGAGPDETQYGYSWIDGHLPLSTYEPTSLMTPEQITADISVAAQNSEWLTHGYVGTKVCVPAQADLQTRAEYMRSVYEVISNALR